MKTDALSVEAEARGVGGDSSEPILLCFAGGNPDDNKMRFVYLINQASVASPFLTCLHTCTHLKIRTPDTTSTFLFFGSLFQEKKKIKQIKSPEKLP